MYQRILISQTAFLGDLILTLPLINAVHSLWLGAKIDVLVRAPYRDFLASHHAVHQVIAYDKRGGEKGLKGAARLASRLRGDSYDLALIPHRSFRSGLIARMAGIPERVGYKGVSGSPFYTRKVERPREAHEGARVLALLRAFDGISPAGFDTRPRLDLEGSAAVAEVENWMDDSGLPQGKRLVALAPGSVWATKRWPEDHWSRLLAMIAGDRTLLPVLVGGPEDRDLCLRVRSSGGERAYVAAGRLSVAGSAELIRRCALLITGDTAPLHLAQAVRTPTLAVFGPTVPEFGFAPTGDSDRIIGLDLPCRPCAIHGSRECPLGHHHCMRWLRENYVHRAAREMIGRTS